MVFIYCIKYPLDIKNLTKIYSKNKARNYPKILRKAVLEISMIKLFKPKTVKVISKRKEIILLFEYLNSNGNKK